MPANAYASMFEVMDFKALIRWIILRFHKPVVYFWAPRRGAQGFVCT